MNEMIENRIIFLFRFRVLYMIVKIISNRLISKIKVNDIT
jgi:hypothetical protein